MNPNGNMSMLCASSNGAERRISADCAADLYKTRYLYVTFVAKFSTLTGADLQDVAGSALEYHRS